MWTCPKCGEQIEDQFTSCWKCALALGATEPQKKKPLERLELAFLLFAAMPGILMIIGGRAHNSAQAAFRLGLFLIGGTGFIIVKIYQHRNLRGRS